MARVLIGTSGWHYDSWRGLFYPKAVALKNQLRYYATKFQTTELNGVFYRTPTPDAVKNWRGDTGKDFVFAWKASKFITHWKRLSQNAVNSLELLEDRLSLLGDKAGPILFQLPPNFAVDCDRLAFFLTLLSKERRYGFEFRNPSWYEPRVLQQLCDHNISICLSDHHDAPAPWKRTANFLSSEVTGPADDIRATTPRRRCGNGPSASTLGRSGVTTSMFTLTTTRRAQPQPMHCGCAISSNEASEAIAEIKFACGRRARARQRRLF
jgi:uncharacterized protein YecE (DUF72 family)